MPRHMWTSEDSVWDLFDILSKAVESVYTLEVTLTQLNFIGYFLPLLPWLVRSVSCLGFSPLWSLLDVLVLIMRKEGSHCCKYITLSMHSLESSPGISDLFACGVFLLSLAAE